MGSVEAVMRLGLFLFAVMLLTASCGDDAKPETALAPTLAPTPSVTPSPSPSPTPAPAPSANPRDAAIAFATWPQKIVESLRPVASLLDTPRPTDARWRTELRDAATAVK